MGRLREFAKENSLYVKLGDGESYEGIYFGFRESSYKGKPLIEYKLDDKILSSSAGYLAECMDQIPLKTKIKITRNGLAMQTTYRVFVDDKEIRPPSHELPPETKPEMNSSKGWDDEES